jgi:hypothetical protein
MSIKSEFDFASLVNLDCFWVYIRVADTGNYWALKFESCMAYMILHTCNLACVVD